MIFCLFFKSGKGEGYSKVERSIVFQFQCIKKHIITSDIVLPTIVFKALL